MKTQRQLRSDVQRHGAWGGTVKTAVDFRISPLSVDALFKALEATAAHPDVDAGAIARYAGIGGTTANRALAALAALGLVRREPKGGHVCTDPNVRRGIDQRSAAQVVRKALLAYRPFEAVCEGLALRESLADAIRKAAVLLGFQASEAKKFQILTKWGIELGLLTRSNDAVTLAPEITPTTAATSAFITSADVESEAKARLFIASRLGREGYNALEEENRALLAEALLNVTGNPSASVEKAGQAIENYLRELCASTQLGVEAGKANGGSQLANLLVGKGLMHSHQQKLVDSVSMFRNARSHHKDKKTLIPWHIDEDGALCSFFSATTAIKSIHAYISHGRQLL